MQCACKNVCLFIYLFWLKRGDLIPRYSHTYYTKLPIFFIFSHIAGTSGHAEMGEHPWVTPIIVSLNTDDYLSITEGNWQKSAILDLVHSILK